MMPQMELSDPSTLIQIELQKTIDLVSFGLQAAEQVKIKELIIPDVTFHVSPAHNKSMNVEEARKAFRAWNLGNGLRDFIDAIGPSLEWARKICFIWTRQGKVSINADGTLHLEAKLTGKEWNEQLLQEGNQFEYWPLRKKLDHLHQSYGLTLPELSDSIIEINYVRNCLTHRRGIVGKEDVRNEGTNKLTVHWKKMQIIIDDGKGQRIIEPPARVEGGERISIGYADVIKEYFLGERIQISSAEFVQIAHTCLLFSFQIKESIQSLQQSRVKEKDK
jgi:hypothetical protein